MGWGACQCSDHSSSPGNASHPSIHPYGHIIIHHEWTDCCWHSGSLHLPDSTCLHLLLWYRWQYVRQTGSHHPLCCIRCCCSYEAMGGGAALSSSPPPPTLSPKHMCNYTPQPPIIPMKESIPEWRGRGTHWFATTVTLSFHPPPWLTGCCMAGRLCVRESF